MPRSRPWWLPALMRRHRARCCYCGEQVVMFRSVRRKTLLRTAHTVTFLNRHGQRVTARIASVEHKINRSDGGGNGVGNLLLACTACNNLRCLAEAWFKKHAHLDHLDR